MRLDRRSLLLGAGAVAAGAASGAPARIPPASLHPLVGAGYRPVDTDEKGLWQQLDRVEEEIAGSNLLVREPGLDTYLKGLIGRVGGPAASDIRVYPVRVADFNAAMFPTGFAIVYSGLLLRMRDEAQLAGVLAHEASHFLLRHQIRQWRDLKRKSDLFTVMAMAAGFAGGATGVPTGNATQLAQLATVLSLFRYSRQLEAEADALGLKLIAEAGYSPMAMSDTWAQLIGETDASAAQRRKRPDRGTSIFADHPAPADRMADLRASAAELTVPGRQYETGRERYLARIAGIRPMLLDDQVRLNDPGASLYVIEALARDGWNGLLRYYEGEALRLQGGPGRETRAALSYAAAVAYPDAPADAWRWHGTMQLKAGQADAGRVSLRRYLALAPAAPDAPFVRQMIASAGGIG